MTKEELNKHFVEWFYNSNWVERYNRNGWMRDHFDNRDADARHYWMLEAFQAGYELYQREYMQEMDKMFSDMESVVVESVVELTEANSELFVAPTATKVTQFATKAAWPFPEE